MNNKKILLLPFLCLSILSLSACDIFNSTKDDTINIAITYSNVGYEFPEHIVEYIENTTGAKLEFTYIPNDYTKEYLRVLFTSNDANIDAVLFSNENTITEAELLEFDENENIVPLNDFINDNSIYFSEKAENFTDYDILKSITSIDGNIYYLPALDYSAIATSQQTMWINSNWLKELNLELPTDIASLEQVLLAFAEYKPQGAPLLGSTESESNFAFNFIINSFTICDPLNYYFTIENGKIAYPPNTQNWREALIYLNKLYEQDLILDENFTYNSSQFISAFNAKENLVGLFTAYNIDDIAFENSPEIWSDYIAIYPLDNAGQKAEISTTTFLPTVGGVILESSQQKETVFEIMDLLCSDTAYLYSHYGIQGEDWDYSQNGEITSSNELAKITVFSQTAQNREIDITEIIGPFVSNPYYSDNVAWVGFQVKQSEHSQTRITLQYQQFMSKENLSTAVFYENLKPHLHEYEELAEYVNKNIIAFTKGDLDINNNEDWRNYLDGFDKYALQEHINLINSYL